MENFFQAFNIKPTYKYYALMFNIFGEVECVLPTNKEGLIHQFKTQLHEEDIAKLEWTFIVDKIKVVEVEKEYSFITDIMYLELANIVGKAGVVISGQTLDEFKSNIIKALTILSNNKDVYKDVIRIITTPQSVVTEDTLDEF